MRGREIKSILDAIELEGGRRGAKDGTGGYGNAGLEWEQGKMNRGRFYSFWSLSEMTNRSSKGLTCPNGCLPLT